MNKKDITETTSSGSIASVAMPLGNTQKRAGSLFKGKKTKKKFYEGKMKDLAYDIEHMSDRQFKQIYGYPKSDFIERLGNPPVSEPAKTKPPVSEAELSEQDLILLPGQIQRKDRSFVPHDKDRRDHEVEMARNDLKALMKDAQNIYKLLQNRTEDQGLMGWQQKYITLASDYLNSVSSSIATSEGMIDTAKDKVKNTLGRVRDTVANSPDWVGPAVGAAIGGVVTRNPRGVMKGAQLGGTIQSAAKQLVTKEGVIAGGMSNFEESVAEGSTRNPRVKEYEASAFHSSTRSSDTRLYPFTQAQADEVGGVLDSDGLDIELALKLCNKWTRMSEKKYRKNNQNGIRYIYKLPVNKTTIDYAISKAKKKQGVAEEVEQVDEEYENTNKEHHYKDYDKWAEHATKTGHRLKDKVVQERGRKARHTMAIVDGQDSSGKPTTAWLGHWHGHNGRGYIITTSDEQRKAIGDKTRLDNKGKMKEEVEQVDEGYYQIRHWPKGKSTANAKFVTIQAKDIKQARSIAQNHPHFKDSDVDSIDRLIDNPTKYGLDPHKVLKLKEEVEQVDEAKKPTAREKEAAALLRSYKINRDNERRVIAKMGNHAYNAALDRWNIINGLTPATKRVISKEKVEQVDEVDYKKYLKVSQEKRPLTMRAVDAAVNTDKEWGDPNPLRKLRNTNKARKFAQKQLTKKFNASQPAKPFPVYEPKKIGEVAEEASPMIKPPANRFASKQEAFAHAKEHGGKVFKSTYIDPNTGNKNITFVVKKEQGVAEAKTLKKRVRVVKGEHADKTGWIREIKHGAFKGAPKSFNVDLDDGGQADNLPASSLRLVKDQQGVAEGERIKTPSGMYRDQHTGVVYRGKTGQDGNDSYMTPDYLIQKYQERLAQIASGPYKRPKEVAQLKSRIAKLQGQKQGVAEGLESFGAVKFRPKTMFQRKVEYYMTNNNIPNWKDKEFHRDPDLEPTGYNWAYYKKNGRVYLELVHHYYRKHRKSGDNYFVEPKNSKKYSYFLVNKDYSLTPLHNVSEGFQNVGLAEGKVSGYKMYSNNDGTWYVEDENENVVLRNASKGEAEHAVWAGNKKLKQKVAEGRFQFDKKTGQMALRRSEPDERWGLFRDGKLIKAFWGKDAAENVKRHTPNYSDTEVKKIDETTKRKIFKEEFKNTYNVGDKVNTPLGNGTIVLVSKTVNVDGKVKVKLDDPSRAGEDGKHKDTYVFTTSMLKHLSEHKSADELLEKKDACYNKVKSRYKVWPSAYASGALVQCRKKGASNWGKKTTKEARGDGQQGVSRGSYQRHSKTLENLIDEWLLLYTQRNTALYMSQMNKAENLFNKMQEIETEMLAKKNGKEELDKLKTYVRKKM